MRILTILMFLLSPLTSAALTFEETFPNVEYDSPELMAFLRDLDYKRGVISLPGGQAELTVPDGYYYLNQADAAKVLVDLWGNPNGESLGMIFPAAYTPYDSDGWGATITWDGSGYVKDDNAADIDYDELLSGMRSDMATSNEWRRKNNYPELSLVGWAAEPYYDSVERKLHWAQEIDFSDSDVNTLNYYLRALGRRGVLELNFIASIGQLEQIRRAIPEVSKMVAFKEGSRYRDFVPSMDTVAAVGIGGLIAGKVVAKTGLLIVALLFLKKFAILLLLPLAWVWKKITGRRDS